ncbi:OST-HTH/LOTUS domain-containing protein [Paracoccus actinidiae]|uniref:OST-HTH/LOTUS domain-containing protein n=1 Tax=Paracoccus actinidiae TaxID=3064531 RepID=UPI0027D33857|nr:OST-HTH/LOTUS domain-containing protein [Paracoccus sp. M09]
MTLHDEGLPAARHAVEHLFGQCLLRLQANELLMKSMVAGHQLSAPMTGAKEAQADRAAETGRKTMGSLVNEMLGSFLVREGQEGMCKDREDAPSIAWKFMIAFPAEEFARIETEHRNLVLLRNTLAHQFLEQHNLRTVGGCRAAQKTLTRTLDRITRASEELRCWASDMKRSRQVLADYLASPDFEDFFVHRRIPWHITTINKALHEAAMELASGDWASVDTAISWITKRYPEEQPESYGCRSWRQVIHETGRFDLQVRKVDGRSQAWYRPRNRVSAQL